MFFLKAFFKMVFHSHFRSTELKNRGKGVAEEGSSRANVVSEAARMDVRIWRELPEEIVVHILARLPVRSFCRLRSVCKQWNTLSENPIFQKLWNGNPSHAPFCIMSIGRDLQQENHAMFLPDVEHEDALYNSAWKRDGYSIYNPSSHLWHELPPSFLESTTCSGKCLLSSSGGLLLLKGSDEDGKRTVFLVNPMNKSKKVLPPLSGREESHLMHFAKLDWRSKDGTYRIFVIDRVQVVERDDRQRREWGISIYLEGQIYDSVTETWHKTGVLPVPHTRLPCEVPYIDVVSLVFHDNYLYCLIQNCFEDVFRVLRCPHNVAHKDEMRRWDTTEVGTLPHHIMTFSHLLVHSGSVQIAGVGKGGRLGLWELDQGSRTWMALTAPLQCLCKEQAFNYESQFVGNGECKWFLFNLMHRPSQYLITWDVLKSKWWKLPNCPYGSFPRDTKTIHLVDWSYVVVQLAEVNNVRNTATMPFVEWRFLQRVPRPLLLHFEPGFDVIA